MVDEQEAGAVREVCGDGVDQLVRAFDRKRQPGHHEGGAGGGSHLGRGVAAGGVLVVGDEQLVSSRQREGAQGGVDAGGGVRHQCQVVGIRADEAGQGGAGRGEQLGADAQEEAGRVGLELGAQLLLPVQHRQRCGAEGAVVELDDVRVQPPVSCQLRRLRQTVHVPHRPRECWHRRGY